MLYLCKFWISLYDSNVDYQNQNLMSCQLDEGRILVEDVGFEPTQPCGCAP